MSNATPTPPVGTGAFAGPEPEAPLTNEELRHEAISTQIEREHISHAHERGKAYGLDA